MSQFLTVKRNTLFGLLLAATFCLPAAARDQTGLYEAPLVTSGIEVGFSPDGGAEDLVLRVIASAKQTIRLAAYSFTSAPVARALVAAKKRGVEVGVVVDYKNNIQQDASGKGKAVLSLLVTAGIPTRVISRYPIHHDKFVVVDGLTVQTGSFNYSAAAAKSNSENVIVVWGNAAVARSYLSHWQSRYEMAADFVPGY